MIPIEVLIALLICHFIGDFVLQSDEMAKNKSKDNWTLTEHVTYYSVPFALSMIFFLPVANYIAFLAFTFILHWFTDYVTSRLTSYLWGKGDRHNFFVVIGVDQMLHYFALFGTYIVLASVTI